MKKRLISSVLAAMMLPALNAHAAEKVEAVMYKNPHCLCCDGHAEHLRQNGFSVEEIVTNEMPTFKQEQGVPREAAGCHTLLVDGYVVEGHVPAPVIHRLLSERPPVEGIALRGMPAGSPGMPGPKREPFEILSFSGGKTAHYLTH